MHAQATAAAAPQLTDRAHRLPSRPSQRQQVQRQHRDSREGLQAVGAAAGAEGLLCMLLLLYTAGGRCTGSTFLCSHGNWQLHTTSNSSSRIHSSLLLQGLLLLCMAAATICAAVGHRLGLQTLLRLHIWAAAVVHIVACSSCQQARHGALRGYSCVLRYI
jgi:hypothetical protein